MVNRLAWWALGGLVAVITAVTMVALAQWAEQRYMPVVRGFTIQFQAQDGKSLVIAGEMDKVRDYCRFVELTAYSGKSYLNIDFQDSTTEMNGRSRAAGVQSWGPWVITPYHDEIRLVARHRCHFLWDTVTVLVEQ